MLAPVLGDPPPVDEEALFKEERATYATGAWDGMYALSCMGAKARVRDVREITLTPAICLVTTN